MKMSLKALVVGAMIATTALFATPAISQAADAPVIHVTGYAQQEVAPDTAYITVGMTATDNDATVARQKNNAVMNDVENALVAMGIAKSDMKTQGFYVSPNYDNNGRKIVSYTVNNNLVVKVTDLDMVPRIISKAGNAGANNIGGIRFTTERADQIKDNLIKQAVHNGRRAALAAATAAGSSLGGVKEMTINGTSPAYERNYPMGASLRKAKLEAMDATPIEAGTNTMTETVNMTFYLQ